MKLSLLGILFGVATSSVSAQVDYVDPTIGNVGVLLLPTRPVVHRPNSMIRMHPLRADFFSHQIKGYPLTIITHSVGEIFSLLPTVGTVTADSWNTPVTYDHEKPTPYHYSVWLEEPATKLEFAPTERCGLFRLTARDQTPVVLLANRNQGELSFIGDATVSGIERFNGMQAYLYGEFDQPMTFASKATKSDQGRLAATPANRTARMVQFRYAISYISVEQAKNNLATEMPDWNLEAVAQAGRDRWNEALGKIQVTAVLAQKRTFYTALYRTHARMINVTEGGNRYYSAYDHQVHEDTRPFYVDNSIWDMYPALEPLHTLLDPKKEADKIASYVRMYAQSGWLPSYAALFGEKPSMTGNHSAAWIADAWSKGVRDFDLKTAYAGLRKNALEGTLLPWKNGAATSLDQFHAEHGYMPAIRPDEKETVLEVHRFERRQAVAVTLQHAFDDWCLAQLARELGHTDDVALFLKRSSWWRNVFRDEKNRVWPKDANGQWIEPFDPAFSGGQGGRLYFTENNAYTYDWDVRHDLDGLFTAMGGRQAAEAKLDQLFREKLGRSKYEFWATFPDSTGLVGQFSMANEPSFAIPYLYNYLGAPWKTQKRIRQLLAAWYPDNIHGLPGDEDGGSMSAFVVFSMMGFYPVTSGVPIYNLGSGVFDRVEMKLADGKTFSLVAKNNSSENKYIQSVTLNGQPLTRLWFTHAELVDGGQLELMMGDQPNLALGTAPKDFPASSVLFSLGPIPRS